MDQTHTRPPPAPRRTPVSRDTIRERNRRNSKMYRIRQRLRFEAVRNHRRELMAELADMTKQVHALRHALDSMVRYVGHSNLPPDIASKATVAVSSAEARALARPLPPAPALVEDVPVSRQQSPQRTTGAGKTLPGGLGTVPRPNPSFDTDTSDEEDDDQRSVSTMTLDDYLASGDEETAGRLDGPLVAWDTSAAVTVPPSAVPAMLRV